MATQNDFEPGTYVRGDTTRYARTRAQAVAFVWDGFRPATAQQPEDVDYRNLQAQAKALGIPANQSAEALQKAIVDYVPPTDDAVDTDDAES